MQEDSLRYFMVTDKKELMTVKEASAYLKVTRNLLAKWRSEGGIGPNYIKVGRAVRYRREDIESWLKKNRK